MKKVLAAISSPPYRCKLRHCNCNCCDRGANKHCGTHDKGCHDSCSG